MTIMAHCRHLQAMLEIWNTTIVLQALSQTRFYVYFGENDIEGMQETDTQGVGKCP